jgi:hypothetical protein
MELSIAQVLAVAEIVLKDNKGLFDQFEGHLRRAEATGGAELSWWMVRSLREGDWAANVDVMMNAWQAGDELTARKVQSGLAMLAELNGMPEMATAVRTLI